MKDHDEDSVDVNTVKLFSRLGMEASIVKSFFGPSAGKISVAKYSQPSLPYFDMNKSGIPCASFL
jgi:hypothetical protein